MRKKIWIPCVIALAVCLLLILFKMEQHQIVAAPQKSEVTTNQTNRSISSVKNAQMPASPPRTFTPTTTKEPLLISNKLGIFNSQILKMWQAPINFYGKVIDENSNPVVGAQVTFHWVEAPSEKGNRTATKQSDSKGLFSVENAVGLNLSVSVSKDGYYVSHQDNNSFTYGSLGGAKFSPDPLNPIIFHLHKKGQGVQLVTSDYGVRPDFPVLVPKDGTPVNVDLLQRKIDSSGDLQISQLKPERAQMQQATNWSFHMNLSDGGFIEENDDFPFTAPETGYQSTIDLDFTKGNPDWATQFSKNYYIVFGQPPKYGLLHVEGNIAQQTVFLKYAINPTGSRNLEPAN